MDWFYYSDNSILAVLFKERGETFYESFLGITGRLLGAASVIGIVVFLLCWLLWLLDGTSDKPVYTPKPTILVCNNITVAESINGFYYSDRSGTYEDYRGKLTYTPRQGEVCKQYLKER